MELNYLVDLNSFRSAPQLSKIQTKILVAGEDAHICDQCIEQAYSILSLQNQPEEANRLGNF